MKELEIGKRYTWREIVAAYPDKWIRLSDCNTLPGGAIIDGTLVGVYSDDEADDVDVDIWNSGSTDEFERTTCGMGSGVIICLNTFTEVHDSEE